MARQIVRWSLIVAAALLILMQAVPYGRAHTNPPTQGEPAWDSPRTRELAVRACFDCHSNQTKWPWYSYMAPASWLVQNHVDEGRQKLNFSEWNRPHDEAAESAEAVQKGEMPMRSYVLAHPEARLSAEEYQALLQGLQATFGGEAEDHEHGHHEGDDH
jgi:hypothetical protein